MKNNGIIIVKNPRIVKFCVIKTEDIMKKYSRIETLFRNRYLNFYHMDAIGTSGKTFDYYFVSRNGEQEIKARSNAQNAEGIVVYPIWKEDPGKIVLIRQFRYPLGRYLYELPAGLIDKKETANQTAVREMKEETGLDFTVYEGGEECFRRPFYMGAGYTDEAAQAVFGWAEGSASQQATEDSESIQVLFCDKKEVRRILREEQVSLRMAYLMMNFLSSDEKEPFRFLD